MTEENLILNIEPVSFSTAVAHSATVKFWSVIKDSNQPKIVNSWMFFNGDTRHGNLTIIADICSLFSDYIVKRDGVAGEVLFNKFQQQLVPEDVRWSNITSMRQIAFNLYAQVFIETYRAFSDEQRRIERNVQAQSQQHQPRKKVPANELIFEKYSTVSEIDLQMIGKKGKQIAKPAAKSDGQPAPQLESIGERVHSSSNNFLADKSLTLENSESAKSAQREATRVAKKPRKEPLKTRRKNKP